MKAIRFFIVLLTALVIHSYSQAQSSGNKPDAAKPDSVALLQEYVGTYTIKGSSDFTKAFVTAENGKLFGSTDTQSQLIPLSSTKTVDVFSFTAPDNSFQVDVTFLRNTEQKVSGIKIYYNGTEVRGEKTKQP
jgi:Domain of unknown function (DUF3471)